MNTTNKSEVINIRTTVKVKERLIEKAQAKEETLSNFISYLLEEHLTQSELPVKIEPLALKPKPESERPEIGKDFFAQNITVGQLILSISMVVAFVVMFVRFKLSNLTKEPFKHNESNRNSLS